MAAYEPFQASTSNYKRHLSELVKQLIQHNVRVIEKYYSRISLTKLAQLVGVSQQRAEAEICDMVVSKRISAKINRLEAIVVFNHKKQYTNEKLSSWNVDVKQILDKIEHTCHLINRE
jgi:26S proteasome regulatory subunit N5